MSAGIVIASAPSRVEAGADLLTGTLPLPPGVNHSYQIVRVGHTHRLAATPEPAAFKGEASLVLHASAHPDWTLVQAIRSKSSGRHKVPLRAELCFCFETLWRRDIDGNIKAVLDACFSFLHLNDTLVTELVVRKRVDAKNPRCEVRIGIV